MQVFNSRQTFLYPCPDQQHTFPQGGPDMCVCVCMCQMKANEMENETEFIYTLPIHLKQWYCDHVNIRTMF